MREQPKDLKPRTKAFALRVIRMYSKPPRSDTAAEVLGKQVLRSGTSVGTNYREAPRGRSKAEFISKIAVTGSNASNLFLECSERQPIEALAEVRGGIQEEPHRAPGANPVRYLTVAHVHRNKILTDSPRYFEVSPEELERWRL